MTEQKDKKDDSELSAEDLERIKGAILAKWKGEKKCPICLANEWTIAPNCVTPMRLKGLSGSIMIGGGSTYPTAMLVCTNCGYTLNFNLVAIGIVPAKTEPEKEGGGNV